MALIELDDSNSSIINEGAVLVDFYSDTCGPCRKLVKTLEKLEERVVGVKMCKLNANTFFHLAEEYKVASVPTMVLFKDGIELDRLNGAKSEEKILEMLNKHVSTEEVKAEQLNEDVLTQQHANASVDRSLTIGNMIKKHFAILNGGSLNELEKLQLGMDIVVAGYNVITESCTSGSLELDNAFACVERTHDIIENIVKQVYLNDDILAKMIANSKAKELDSLSLAKQ